MGRTVHPLWRRLPSQFLSHSGGETLWGGLDPVPGAMGFPNGLVGRESACSEGDPSSIPGWEKIPWRSKWQPSPVFLPGKSYGERSLAGYSPWGCKRVEPNLATKPPCGTRRELRSKETKTHKQKNKQKPPESSQKWTDTGHFKWNLTYCKATVPNFNRWEDKSLQQFCLSLYPFFFFFGMQKYRAFKWSLL